MVTVLDIIDTSVKIGLGALITGLSAYLVMREKNKHEMTKSKALYERDILKEVTLQMEKSSALIAEFIHLTYSEHPLNKLERSKNKLIESSIISGNAASLSNMAGFSDLTQDINKYHQKVLGFHDYLAGDLEKIVNEYTYESINEINKSFEKVQSSIALTYNSRL